jgi:hypothetical protein
MIGALVFAAATATIELSDRTDVRLREAVGFAPALDLATAPRMDLQVHSPRWTLLLGYSPSLLLQNVAPPPTEVVFLNNATVSAGWQDHDTRLTLLEDATYGRENTTYLAQQSTTNQAGQTNALQLLPQNAETIDLGSSRTMLLAGLRPAKRLQLSLDVGYSIYGGLDQSAREVLPLQRGPFADASMAYVFNPADRFIANVDVSHVAFVQGPCLALELVTATPTPAQAAAQCAPDDYIGVATMGWSHALTRLSSASVSVGASAVRSRLDTSDPFVTHAYPAGTLTYQYKVGVERRPTTIRFDAQLAPTVDFRSGVADNRVQATVTGVWTGSRLTLTQIAGAARSLGAAFEPPATLVLTTSSIEYLASKLISLGASLDFIWQNQENVGTLTSFLASLSFTVRAPVERF